MVALLPLQFGIPGGMELVVILLIAVLLFGANKIPKLARSTGEAMGEFQKGREEVEKELQEMREGATGEMSTGTADSPAGGTDGDTTRDEVDVADAETDPGTASPDGPDAETTADSDSQSDVDSDEPSN